MILVIFYVFWAHRPTIRSIYAYASSIWIKTHRVASLSPLADMWVPQVSFSFNLQPSSINHPLVSTMP